MSRLYGAARASLTGAERQALDDFFAWLDRHPGSAKAAVDGYRVGDNVCAESHLVGDSLFGDPGVLTAFLRRCAERFLSAATADERHAAYEAVCEEFSKRGLPIDTSHLPDRLLRYVTNRRLLGQLAHRILGRSARRAAAGSLNALVVSFPRLRARWSRARLTAAERLGGSPDGPVFATFEHPASAPRADAVALTRALALPFWGRPRSGPEIVVEYTYETSAVANHRFPTVADAGWIHLFAPAPEVVPDTARPETCCGWSGALGGQPKQPEIVHDNAPLSVLLMPPRLVGTVPV